MLDTGVARPANLRREGGRVPTRATGKTKRYVPTTEEIFGLRACGDWTVPGQGR